jgi:hypothetical protein
VCVYIYKKFNIYIYIYIYTYPGRNKIRRQDGSIPWMPHKVVPWFRQSTVSVSSQWHQLYPWPNHGGFVVLKLH